LSYISTPLKELKSAVSVISEMGFENAMLENIDPPVWFMAAFMAAQETAAYRAKFS